MYGRIPSPSCEGEGKGRRETQRRRTHDSTSGYVEVIAATASSCLRRLTPKAAPRSPARILPFRITIPASCCGPRTSLKRTPPRQSFSEVLSCFRALGRCARKARLRRQGGPLSSKRNAASRAPKGSLRATLSPALWTALLVRLRRPCSLLTPCHRTGQRG